MQVGTIYCQLELTPSKTLLVVFDLEKGAKGGDLYFQWFNRSATDYSIAFAASGSRCHCRTPIIQEKINHSFAW